MEAFNKEIVNDKILVSVKAFYDEVQKKNVDWAHKHPLWNEVRELVRCMQDDILKQLKAKKTRDR